MRETITVTADDVRALAVDVRRWAGELRDATARTGSGTSAVSANLAEAAQSFDAMWLAWSTALDQLAGAMTVHADTLGHAADDYEEVDASAIPNLPVGP
jgi:uncharacterized protein YukE